MARASNIYIVVTPDYSGDQIEAAFTVKHECRTWLERNPSMQGREVLRLPDGNTSQPEKRRTDAEFLGAA